MGRDNGPDEQAAKIAWWARFCRQARHCGEHVRRPHDGERAWRCFGMRVPEGESKWSEAEITAANGVMADAILSRRAESIAVCHAVATGCEAEFRPLPTSFTAAPLWSAARKTGALDLD